MLKLNSRSGTNEDDRQRMSSVNKVVHVRGSRSFVPEPSTKTCEIEIE